MTDAELWAAVGAELERVRIAAGMKFPADVEKKHPRAPTVNTIKGIEAGRPKSLTALADYCDALGVKISEVIAAALPTSTMTAEAARVGMAFQNGSPGLKAAMRAVLQLEPAPARQPGDGKVGHKRTAERSERGR